MVLGVFTRASTVPDDPANKATVMEGIYNYRVGRHHINRQATEINPPVPTKDNGDYYTYEGKVRNAVTKKLEDADLPIDNWKKGAYPALRLQGGIPATYGNWGTGFATYINSHVGYDGMRGSEGCMTLYESDYQTYMNLFNGRDKGKMIIAR